MCFQVDRQTDTDTFITILRTPSGYEVIRRNPTQHAYLWGVGCGEGGVRLRRQCRQEYPRHHGHLPPASVHLRRHRRPALRGNVLHVHRLVQGNSRYVQVLYLSICFLSICLQRRRLVTAPFWGCKVLRSVIRLHISKTTSKFYKIILCMFPVNVARSTPTLPLLIQYELYGDPWNVFLFHQSYIRQPDIIDDYLLTFSQWSLQCLCHSGHSEILWLIDRVVSANVHHLTKFHCNRSNGWEPKGGKRGSRQSYLPRTKRKVIKRFR